MICETCASPTGQIGPCPCGLDHECPVRIGVCPDCYQIIQRNAVDRRHEYRKAA
jgi:hypothetical protein